MFDLQLYIGEKRGNLSFLRSGDKQMLSSFALKMTFWFIGKKNCVSMYKWNKFGEFWGFWKGIIGKRSYKLQYCFKEIQTGVCYQHHRLILYKWMTNEKKNQHSVISVHVGIDSTSLWTLLDVKFWLLQTLSLVLSWVEIWWHQTIQWASVPCLEASTSFFFLLHLFIEVFPFISFPSVYQWRSI